MFRLLVAAAGLGALVSIAAAQDRPPTPLMPSISVTGTASRDVEPDRASITVGVTTERQKPADASAENAKAAQTVVAAIKDAGVEPRDIRTSSLTLSPVYASGTGGAPPRLTGYRASNQVNVTVRKLADTGALIQQLSDKGITNLSGIAFDVSNADAIVDELRGEAAKDARRKADLYAAGLNLKVGRVLEIRTENAPPPPVFRARAVAAAIPAPPPPVEAGNERLSTEVGVTFELVQ